MNPEYFKKISKIEELPPLPRTLHEVLNKLNNADTDAKDLEKLIEEDPTLTTKILKIANSPFFGQAGKVNSIKRAIILLGFNEIRNLVIGLSLANMFDAEIKCGPIDAKALWIHSIGVAKTAQILALKLKIGDPDEFFTAGLIHDIGLFVQCIYLADDMKNIFDIIEEKKVSLPEAEEIYGLKHTEVGAFLAKKWDLSDFITNMIRYHHKPTSAGEYAPLASILFLANELCDKTGLGIVVEESSKKILIPRSIQISIEIIKEVVERIKEEKKIIEESWVSNFIV